MCLDFTADGPAIAQGGLGILLRCLMARIPEIHSVVGQAQEVGMKGCQNWINGDQSLKKKRQVVDFWHGQAGFLEMGFKIFLSTLLTVEADGIGKDLLA